MVPSSIIVNTSFFLFSGTVARTDLPFLPLRDAPTPITTKKIMHGRFRVIFHFFGDAAG
jgi:hypothetical protein